MQYHSDKIVWENASAEKVSSGMVHSAAESSSDQSLIAVRFLEPSILVLYRMLALASLDICG